MNRSFSKKRHIQESNLRLEKRFLLESTEAEQEAAALESENIELSQAGLPEIDMETINKFDNGEDVSSVENQISVVEPNADLGQIEPIKKQLRQAFCSADKSTLKNVKRQLISLLKGKKKVQEQLETMTILGVTAAPWVFLALAGFLLIMIIVLLVRPKRDGWGCRGTGRIMTRVRQ